MVVVVLVVGETVIECSIWPIWKFKYPEPLPDGPATSEYVSAFVTFIFPSNTILYLCVTTSTTMHVRAAKALFYVIM